MGIIVEGLGRMMKRVNYGRRLNAGYIYGTPEGYNPT